MNFQEFNLLANFLTNGKSLYLEGVDIGTSHQSFDLLGLFGANYLGQGVSIPSVDSLIGVESYFCKDFSFGYPTSSNADYMLDKMVAVEGEAVFKDQNDFERVIAYSNSGAYRAIASTIIFGAIVDLNSLNSKINLLDRYLSFLFSEENPKIKSLPTEVNFETVFVNYVKKEKIRITNIGLNSLELSNISVNGEGFSYNGNSNIEVDFMDTVELEIEFISNNVGDFLGTLSFSTNDPNNNNVSINLESQVLLPPEQIIDANEFNFTGNIDTIISGGNFTITNNGQSTLKTMFISGKDDRLFGGPDSFGYHWFDSSEENGPEYEWNDISGQGNEQFFADNDTFTNWIDMGFFFPFYEEVYSRLRISANGFITFSDTDNSLPLNNYIPNVNNPVSLISPYWDDLNPISGDVFTYSDNENNRFIIQFKDVSLNTGDENEKVTFQVHLYKNGTIDFVYKAMILNTNSGSVGIQSPDGLRGLEVVCNNFFPFYRRVIRLLRGNHWLFIEPNYVEIEPGNSEDILIKIDTHGLQEDSYSSYLDVFSNDPGNSFVRFPVTVNVNSTADDYYDLQSDFLISEGSFPNPFNISYRGGTKIHFSLLNRENVNISIFNIKGELIKNIADKVFKKGNNYIFWSGEDKNNNLVSSGVYFYSISTKNSKIIKKMVLLK